jgi:hypothetical protein
MRSRNFLVPVCVLALILTMSSAASADPGGDSGGPLGALDLVIQSLIGSDDDFFATSNGPAGPSGSNSGSQQFGPYPSETTDSGTCGINDWAEDVVDRYFHIQATGLNTYRVIEKFKRGTFQTLDAASPGACDSSDGTPPGTITTGYSGTFQGYIVMSITSATYTPGSASCLSPCFSTNEFLVSVFGPVGAATRNDDAYFFHYQASNQGLVYHEWKNASCNRGGNHGDIQSASAPLTTAVPLCP